VKSPQSRYWTSFLEFSSATGKLYKPGIIFKGKDLQAQWFIDEFKQTADWYYICTEKGWTDTDTAMKWLEFVYLPQTKPEDEGDARLIILDGHNSHTTVSHFIYIFFRFF